MSSRPPIAVTAMQQTPEPETGTPLHARLARAEAHLAAAEEGQARLRARIAAVEAQDAVDKAQDAEILALVDRIKVKAEKVPTLDARRLAAALSELLK